MATPKLKKVVINSIDVSNYVLEYKISKEYTQYITDVTLSFSQGLSSIITVSDDLIGTEITIQRGVSSATEKYIFRGEIRNIEFNGSSFIVGCRDKLYETVRTYVTYSFDKNIDDEAGVVSEIFKTLINDYTSLTANSTSVQNSGTAFILDKFVCRDTPIYERLTDLAKAINWQFYYDADDDLVYFEPKGYTSSTTIFEVGVNISEVPKWTYNSDLLANKVTVRGAEQLVETTEFFNGTGADNQEVQLAKTPISVKVYVGTGAYDPTGTGTRPSDNEATLQDGGKQGSTSGTYYYEYDDDSNVRKVYFGAAGTVQPTGVPALGTNNIEVRYTYKLPVPIVTRNQDSIDKYGIHEKIIVKSDIKNVSDAEVYAQKQIEKYGEVFATTELKVIDEEDIDVGRLYTVIDNVNGINNQYLVSKLVMEYPNTRGDKVTVGDELWKTDNWDVQVWDRLKRLEEQQTETTDLLVDLRQFSRDITYERRYALTQTKDRSGDGTGVFILGHPTFGILGTQELGDSSATFEDYCLVQGNNKYKEYIYDDLFCDDGTSTATIDTNVRTITFSTDNLYSKKITQGSNIKSCNITVYFTGDITFEITADADSVTPTWDTVILSSGISKSHTFTVPGDQIKYRISDTGGAVISSQQNDFDEWIAPGIQIDYTYA